MDDDKTFYFSGDLFDTNLSGGKSIIELAEAGEFIETAIFREGKFNHRWYGQLDFTKDYLGKIVNNFNAGTNPQAISVNKHHEPEHGAYGWVEQDAGNLFTKELTFTDPLGREVTKSFLFARWKPTPKGIEAIKNKEFRYFSAEISDEFTTNEIHKVAGKKEEDDEAIVKSGPTMTAFAITNTPFIPNLPGMFSKGLSKEEADNIEVDKYSEDGIPGTFVLVKPNTEENGEEGAEGEEPETNTQSFSTNPTQKPKENNKMKFSKALQDLQGKEGEARYSFCKEIRTKVNAGEIEATEVEQLVFSELEKAIEADHQKSIALNASIKEAEQLKNKNKEFSKQRAELEIELRRAREGSYNSRVKAFSAELENKNHFPSVVNKVTEILNDVTVEAREQKFSLTSAGDEGDKVDPFHLFSEVLEAIPEEARFDTSQQFSANSGEGEGNDTPVAPEGGAQGGNAGVDKAYARFPEELRDRVRKYCEANNYNPELVTDASIFDEDGNIKFD